MSKFIDKLKQTSQPAHAPIGFLSRQLSPSKSRIQLLAVVAPENLDRAADFATGADAILLPVASKSPSIKRLTGLADAVADILWGGWLKGGHAGVPEMVKAGCDFVVFPASPTPLTITADSGAGKILEVEASLTEGLLRAVNDLPVDAVFVNDDATKDESLTWQQLMLFQRFSYMLTKPLLVSVPSSVGAEELKVLWKAGVDCVVVETEGMPPNRLKELRKTIDSLVFPSPRRKEKMIATLPRIGREPSPVNAEEEEEEVE